MLNQNRLFREVDLRNTDVDLDYPSKYYDSSLLGQLSINRVAGIAFFRLSQTKINLNRIPSEYLDTLSAIYKSNLERSAEFLKNLDYMAGLFCNAPFKHAFLKGAFLASKLYERGLRTSNDIDVLILSKDISACQKLLLENGFIQGHKRGDIIIPAERAEIINSRMNYGETIPLHKKNEEGIFSVDLNTSLDFKPSVDSILMNRMLDSAVSIQIGGGRAFFSLDAIHFIMHLCCHLYKEATTFDWVATMRDLKLYKFVDILVFLDAFGSDRFFSALTKEINELQLNRECYYTFENSAIIFPRMRDMPGFSSMLSDIRPSKLEFMVQVVNPKSNEVYYHQKSFEDWFFCEDRVAQLRKAL
jgi:hypothetical protein